ncbi:hypothetical protein EDB92DRAFT_1820007 [Lactarius akahatsu]|uniref:Uncharacterized protein n=1 Tax=Lactarius akahatsu TaxID=416441 RepID=A0AAD4LA86_9AGAM|nr:hypothetical protein EDB92DRAFT_1820007 [Lactarius akahatsu]
MSHRTGRSHVFAHKPHRRANPTCNTGGFYVSPTASQTFEYTTPANISWDTTCLNATNVDIFLYAPGTGSSRVHAWQSVYFPAGSYQTTLKPKWWNSTASANLQFSIVPSGTPPFLSPYPAGPIFTVTYHAPSSGTPADADTSKPDGAITVVKNAPTTHKPLAGGKVAAAVLMPLLVVIALVSLAYIKLRRERGKEERKQWSEAIDKRMSTISTDWKPISAAGAQAAIRSSMAVDGSIRSSFSFGNIRPDSTVAVEGGQAGIGSRARTVLPGQSNGTAQLRSSANAQIIAERVSRVSFAPDVRASSETRRTVQSRAYHTSIVPPLPDRKWEIAQSYAPGSEDGSISPTQTDGPQTLSIEDIQARLAGRDTSSRPSVDAVMPALRLMRTSDPSPGAHGEDESELLFSAQSGTFPAIPSPTHSPRSPEPASAMSSFMPMQPMPANMMSPDDMLRAYAERRATASAGIAGGPTVPSPAYTGVGAQGGMRTLYSPTQAQSQAATDNLSTRRTTIGSQYSGYADEDAYSGATL